MKKILLLFCLFPFFIVAQTYIHDANFGDNGKVTSIINNTEYLYTTSNIILDNDSLLSLFEDDTSVNLLKHLPSGELDTSFGTNGFLDLTSSTPANYIDMKVFSNQKILLSYREGSSPNYNYFLKCLLLNGTLDSSFGNNGILPVSQFNKVEIINDKIIASRNVVINSENQVQIIRLLENGSNDTSFGDNGVLNTYVNGEESTIKQLSFYNNMFYISFYNHTTDPLQYYNYIISIDNNGVLNTSFATNGILEVYADVHFQAVPFTINSNGKLICVIKTNNSFNLKQYNLNGNLDTGFGVNGLATNTLDFSNNMYGFVFSSIICKPNNSLFVIGALGGFEDTQLIIHKFNENGGLDTNFSLNIDSSYQWEDVLFKDNALYIFGSTYWYEGDENTNIFIDKYIPQILSTNSETQHISIFPNPVLDFLIVNHNLDKNPQYIITDLIGKVVKKGLVSNSKIDLSFLTKGVYLVKINKTTYKIVKK